MIKVSSNPARAACGRACLERHGHARDRVAQVADAELAHQGERLVAAGVGRVHVAEVDVHADRVEHPLDGQAAGAQLGRRPGRVTAAARRPPRSSTTASRAPRARIIRRVTAGNLALQIPRAPQSHALDGCRGLHLRSYGNTPPIRSRRHRATLSLAVLVTLVALAAVPAARAEPPLVKAQSARAFGDSVGVNGYFAWLDTRLRRLRHDRRRGCASSACATSATGCARPASTRSPPQQARGARDQVEHPRRHAGPGQRPHAAVAGGDRAAACATRSISVEPPNEPNLPGDPSWIQHARDYQRELWTRVKGDPQLAHLTVLGPAVGWPASPRPARRPVRLPRPGQLHPYPGGNPPLYNIDDRARMTRTPWRGQAADSDGVRLPLRPRHDRRAPPGRRSGRSAIYMPRLALEGFRNGVERTYVYQLADPWPARRQPRLPRGEQLRSAALRPVAASRPSSRCATCCDAVDGDSAPVAIPGGLRFGLEGAGPTCASCCCAPPTAPTRWCCGAASASGTGDRA